MRQGQKPGGGKQGKGKGKYTRHKVNMLSQGGEDAATGTRVGFRSKSTVHFHYPSERCSQLFMGVSVAGAYCTTSDSPWQCAAYALIGRLMKRLHTCGMRMLSTLSPT